MTLDWALTPDAIERAAESGNLHDLQVLNRHEVILAIFHMLDAEYDVPDTRDCPRQYVRTPVLKSLAAAVWIETADESDPAVREEVQRFIDRIDVAPEA